MRTSFAPAFSLLLTSLASAACGFSGAEGTPPADAGVIEPDAEPPPPIDAPPIPQMAIDFLPPNEETFASGNWDIGNTTVTIDTTTITASVDLPANVTLTEGTQHDGLTKVAILRANNFKVTREGVLKVKGSRPLFIVAGNDLVVDGVLDAGADLAVPGPGGSSGGMGTGAGRSSVHDGGTFLFPRYNDSGAGGGSFGSTGAAGGRAGYAGSSTSRTYGIGNRLIGGASGGRAGSCPNPPGAGGGALLLYGHKKIVIKGVVSAGGGGGAGGLDMDCAPGAGAGAGGGSGGVIWLQTPTLEGTGLLTANGGGGGGGAGAYSQSGNNNGMPGANAHASDTAIAAGGAKANTPEATAGGSGAIQGTPASAVPGLNAGNGGGGGGGLGRIVFNAPIIDNIKSSPTAEAAP